MAIESAGDRDVWAEFIADDADDVAVKIGEGDAADCAVEGEADSVERSSVAKLVSERGLEVSDGLFGEES